jgi:hypothetical protein
MKQFFLFLAAALPAAAHMVSVSTGEAILEGSVLHYELRMPLFEAQHIAKRETLLDSITFEGATRTSGSCQDDKADGSYRCTATYQYPSPPDRLTVQCLFHKVTVPNHIHVLRAVHAGKTDQAVFEMAATKATLRFEPPSALESAVTRLWSGFARAAGTPAPVLFLLALVLAARSRRELGMLVASFFGGQTLVAFVFPYVPWYPSERFIEAAAALTVAYLAVEVLLLPKAGQRWLVVGVLGLFHGLAFSAYLRSSGQTPGWFLAGALAGELLLAAVLQALVKLAMRVPAPSWLARAPAAVLLATGLGWFAWLLV